MARSAPALSTFTAGEISPRLEGRVSIEKYREGLSDLTNMIVQPHGGVTRRSGTEFLGEVKDSTKKTRLIPFQFKTADTYILEFGDQYMRVYRQGLQVLNVAEAISDIQTAGGDRVEITTSGNHGFSSGEEFTVWDIADAGSGTSYELLNNRNFRADVIGTVNTFNFDNLWGEDVIRGEAGTYDAADGGYVASIYEITTPYTEDQLDDIRFAQSADVMYLVHPEHQARQLSRTDHDAWTLTSFNISSQSGPPYINNATDNYPSVVTFFEQRLVFGATNNNPQTLWFSKSADYDNFTTGTASDAGLIYTIASSQVNAIRFLAGTRVLTIGTSGGEYVLTTTNGGPLTPTSAVIRKYSNYGCVNREPVQVADLTLFTQRGGRKVREFQYGGDVNTAAYAAVDITILAEHLTKDGLSHFAYQQEPESIVWALRQDGTLLGLTYRREEEVVAWHKHVIGGSFNGGSAVVESIATLPTDSGEDELYMIVKRTINGTTKRYIERMKPYDFGSDVINAFFVDSGLSYAGSATGKIRGLNHIRGETASILANGSTHPDQEVSSPSGSTELLGEDGYVDMAFDATSAAIGFGYTSQMQTLRLESGSVDGTSQGKPKRIHDLTIRFHETVGAEVGADENNLDRIFFRDSSMAMDQAVPLFTGDKEIEFVGGYDDDARIFVRQTQPLPLTVLALYPRMNTFDL